MIDPTTLDTWLWALWALPFGLIVGSFSNVVYYRLPIMIEQEVQGLPPTMNLSLPRSHCPVCESTLRARELVPVISYLAVGGRCRSCKTPIPKRYPLIELGFGLLAVVCAGIWGLSSAAGAAYAFMVVLTLAALIDAKSQWLPDVLTYTLLWAGVLAASLDALPTGVSLAESVWGVIVGYGILAIVDYVMSLRHGHPVLGGGDMKLVAALGAWVGIETLPQLVLLGCGLGLIGAMIAWRRKTLDQGFAFGPWLALSGMTCFVYLSQ